jgi:hypothetical protein
LPEAVSKRLSCICLFSAWLCASGALLDLTQVFAWARMFAGYSRTLPLREAAVMTMDPDKPCPICLAVRRAREAESRQQPPAMPSIVQKMPLLAQVRNEPFVFHRDRPAWPDAPPARAPSWRAPVPVPPPRTSVRSILG